ncbi:acyl carrier protein, partial [Variovorax sp. YR752]|uniref:acyl carrier protein n=1 Tax=Variovorax sp. YR752 TaxID=1884383 RepID=UPI003137DF58
AGAPAAGSAGAAVAGKTTRAEAWMALPASQRRGAVLAHLAEQARQVIGLAPDAPIGTALPLKEAGLDSLMAVELRNQLTRSVGRPLPATLLFDHPSLDALADELSRRLGLATAVAAAPTATELGVATLSEAQAEAELLAELAGQTPAPRR